MYICIDIGGTAIKYGLASADGQLIETKSTPTHAHQGGGPGIVRTVRQLIRQYMETGPLLGIALSTAGMVDPQKGRIFYALADSIPDYTGTEWKEILEGEFHIPCAVENDVNCAALGELWLGAGKGCTSAFMMTIGTSIGGCAIYDGHIIHGAGCSAGEIAYMRVPGGRLHDLASATRLVRDVATAKGVSPDELDGKAVFSMAAKGDTDALRAIDDLSRDIAVAIGNVITVLQPQVVILGGGIMAQEGVFRPRLERYVSRQLPPAMYEPARIAFARLGNRAGMLGALYHLRQQLSQE